ncbi:MAG: hypothetical protein CMB80_18170 [Flammeovirgaceae bacterium]|nr:hypothetical protein [Flammeovirgaceae bacterium]
MGSHLLIRGVLIICTIHCNLYLYSKGVYMTKIYSTRDGLPSNTVYAAQQDNLGYIWFGTSRGLSRFDGNEFVNFGINDGAPDSDVLNFFKDSKDQIWCYSMNGNLAIIYDGEIHKKTLEGWELASVKEQILSFVEFDGDYYLSTRHYVWKLSEGELERIDSFSITGHFMIENGSLFFLENGIQPTLFQLIGDDWVDLREASFLGRPQAYALMFKGRVYSYNYTDRNNAKLFEWAEDDHINVVSFSFGIINLHLRDKLIYLLTQGGVFIYNPVTQLIEEYIANFASTDYLVDKDSNEWVTGLNSGVMFRRSRRGSSLLNGKAYANILSRKENYIVNDKLDSVWNLTPAGVGEFVRSSFLIRDVHKLKNGQLLLGSENVGSEPIFPMPIRHIQPYGDTLLASSYDKVLVYSNASEKPELVNILANHGYRKILKIVNPTDSGFIFLNQQGLYFSTLDSVPKISDIYTKVSPTDMLHDDQRFIFGTNGIGLIKIEGKDTAVASTRNGKLSSDFVKKLLFKNDQLWVLTTEGLDILTIDDNGDFVYKFKITGVPGKITSFGLTEEVVLMTTTEGLYKLDITEASETIPVPVFIINSSGSRSVKLRIDSCSFVLPPDVKDFELDFSTIFFHPELPMSYRYRMATEQGLVDQTWTYLDRSELYMTNLQSGEFVLEVQFKHQNIGWTEGARIQITVSPYWWETIWFRALVLMLVSVLITYVSFRINGLIKARKRQRTEHLLAELRSRKAQLNPHFVFNALNSVRNFILVNDLSQSDQFLTTYSKLMRSILDMSNKLLVPIGEEIEVLSLYLGLERIRLGKSFEYNVDVDETLDMHELKCPALITQPYVENSVWHGVAPKGEGGQISIQVQDIDTKIRIVIADNGVGFDQHIKNENSFGTFIAQDKIRLLKKTYDFDIDVSVKSSVTRGTKVNILLPKIKK